MIDRRLNDFITGPNIFEEVTLMGIDEGANSINRITKHEYNSILKEFKSLYDKFIDFMSSRFNPPSKEFDESLSNNNFNCGKEANLLFSYKITKLKTSDKKMNDRDFDRFVLSEYMMFCKSNGFEVAHNVMDDYTYGRNSDKYPNLLLALRSRKNILGKTVVTIYLMSKTRIYKK